MAFLGLEGRQRWHLLGAGLAVTTAILIGRIFDAPAIGWGIGAAIMAVSATLTFVPAAKRGIFQLVIWPVVCGVGIWALFTYIPL